MRGPGAAVGRLAGSQASAWLRQGGRTFPQNDSSEAPGCRLAQERERVEKKGLSVPTSVPVKGGCGMEAAKRFSFSSRPVPLRLGIRQVGRPRATVGRGAGPGLPLLGIAAATASPGDTPACGGGRGPGPGCAGGAVICLLLCGRRNLTLVLITSSMGTTTKIVQQTSVHIARFGAGPAVGFFLLLYILREIPDLVCTGE